MKYLCRNRFWPDLPIHDCSRCPRRKPPSGAAAASSRDRGHWSTATSTAFSSTRCIGPRSRLSESPSLTSKLASRYAAQFNLDRSLLFTDLEDMLQKTHPQAVLAYTNTYDHRQVVEICARHGVPVMMEKPLAVSAEDAHAIADAARKGKIQVLVNYETSWYRSNHAAYDMVHEKAIGDIRKVVVHDGHQGPKEINVQPEFFAWLNDPKLNGGRSALRLRLLWRRLDDLADGRAAADLGDRCHPADQAGNLYARG